MYECILPSQNKPPRGSPTSQSDQTYEGREEKRKTERDIKRLKKWKTAQKSEAVLQSVDSSPKKWMTETGRRNLRTVSAEGS